MKKSRFGDSQIIDALKRAEADLAVPELCRELCISSATFYKWCDVLPELSSTCASSQIPETAPSR